MRLEPVSCHCHQTGFHSQFHGACHTSGSGSLLRRCYIFQRRVILRLWRTLLKILSRKYTFRAGALKVALVAVFRDSEIDGRSILFQNEKKS